MTRKLVLWIIGLLLLFTVFQAGKVLQRNLTQEIKIVSAVGVDLDGDRYRVSVQVLNPLGKSKGQSEQVPYHVYSDSQHTFSNALSSLSKIASSSLFLNNAEVVVISDKLAEARGIDPILDFLNRERKLSANIHLVLSKGVSAEALLKIYDPEQQAAAVSVNQLLRTSSNNLGIAFEAIPNKIKSLRLQNRQEIALPFATAVGDPKKGMTQSNIGKYDPEARIAMGGIAVFKQAKAVQYLSEENSSLLLLLQGRLKETDFEFRCPRASDRFWSLDAIISRSRIAVAIRNQTPRLKVRIEIHGVVEEEACLGHFSKPNAVQELNAQASEALQQRIRGLIQKSQAINSDYIGFGDELYRNHPSQWSSVQDRWPDLYRKADTDISVRVTINSLGQMLDNPAGGGDKP